MDVIGMLDSAVARARAAGLEVDGWTMQSGGDGYVAWLYREDEEGQAFLFDEVEVCASADDAAQACLDRVDEAVGVAAGGD